MGPPRRPTHTDPITLDLQAKGKATQVNSPEAAALDRALQGIQERQALVQRLHDIAQHKAAFEHGYRTATPERREERRIQKQARKRKKAERKQGRR